MSARTEPGTEPRSGPLWNRLPPFAVLGLALALAVAIRLPLLARADFPLHDGGLFYAMASDVADHGFALPRFTTYNGGDIPFAYPPLGIYLVAAIRAVTGWSLAAVVQWLPLLPNLLTVLAVALLAGRMLGSRRSAAVAALAFPCLPFSYEWLIMGGGVTRSFGLLFLALTALAMSELARSRRRAPAVAAALCAGLAVLSHPELGLLALGTVVLFAVVLLRGRGAWRTAGALTLGALAVAAPWWATVLVRFGAAPFLAASHGSSLSWQALVNLFVFPLTGEPFLRVFGVLGVRGLITLAFRSPALVPLWFLLVIALVPRNAVTPLTLPLALAVGAFVGDVVLPGAAHFLVRGGRRRSAVAAPAVLAAWVLAYGVVENRILATQADERLPVLTSEQRDAMAWISMHCPPGSRFLVLSSPAVEGRDAVLEWFPALAGRVSVATPQGAEWIGSFDARSSVGARVRRCVAEGAPCLESVQTQSRFTHVFIARPSSPDLDPLPASLLSSGRYRPLAVLAGGTVLERAAR